jgi:hypothetical protein
MLDGVLNPALIGWTDIDTAARRTAPPPSLLATPSRLCLGESVLVNFNFIKPNANLGWNTGNTATTTCYPTRVSPCRQGIAKRPASAVPTSHWPTNKPLAHQQALVRRRSGCHLQSEDPGRLVARTIESTDSSGHSFNYQSQQGDHHVEPSY